MRQTARGISLWRLSSQRLLAPHAPSVTAVLDHLLAVQAENSRQSEWALASRTAGCDPAELPRLLGDGKVVRTHILRPTWHYVPVADISWLLELTAPRVRQVFLRQLTSRPGWSAAWLDGAVGHVIDLLAERPDRSREEIALGLRERGMPLEGHPLMLLLGYAEQEQLICSGRPVAGRHTYALFADRVPKGSSTRFDRDEALAELARRYFIGHGPATERDLAYWATLPLRDVRCGLDSVRDELDSFSFEGRTYWHGPGGPPSTEPEPEGHLLQILDEMYRGYQETRMVLDAEGVVPAGRETVIGMGLVRGQMVAGMTRTLDERTGRVRFDLSPYRPLSGSELRALELAAARYGGFLGLEPDLVIRPS